MLELLAAAVLTQTPITLQALVPTSGDRAEALLDGKAKSGWTPEGDSEGEGVLFRFESETEVHRVFAQTCGGMPVFVTPFVNGTEYAQVSVETARTPVATVKGRKVRSVFLRIDDPGAKACLGEVYFITDKKPLEVRAPRGLQATAKASSVLAPADAYHPGYLFDGRLDFGWVEGVKGPGVGESMTLTFTEPITLTALELWNGYQRSEDHFKKNARAKKLAIGVDGAEPLELDVKDEQGSQKLTLPKPATTRSLTLTIKDAWPGTKYEDLVLSELRVWDAEGPRAIVTGDLRARAKAMKAEVEAGALKGFVDKTLRAICKEGQELEAKFRTNHTFVVYRTTWGDTGETREVLDGTWIVKDGKVELFGRSHRNETNFDPYASPGPKETTTIIGGPLKVTRVGELKKPDYDALVAKFSEGPLKASYGCARVKQFDTLADAWVVEGRAVTAILTP